MKNKFRNKYHIQSRRMPKWDYSGNGCYFITLVTQNREYHLGIIKNGEMELSDFGKIVETEWHKSFKIRNELFLDDYIIMPNHLHAIVVLKKSVYDSPNSSDTHNTPIETHGPNLPVVETHDRASLLQDINDRAYPHPSFYRKTKSLSSFIAGFKSVVNSKINDFIDEHNLDISKYNRNNHFFQPNYHDHIIRNQREYHRIKNYIINNPANWDGDGFNPLE